jgi:hypothetical protein
MTRAAGKGIERLDPATNQVFLGGRGDVPQDVGVTVSHKLFAPRLGIAYRLNDKTVIRTGYGLTGCILQSCTSLYGRVRVWKT